MDMFGLGIYIDFEDRASSGLDGLNNTFKNTETGAQRMVDNIEKSYGRLQSLSIAGLALNQMGNSFYNTGQGVLGTLKGWGTEVAKVGEDFENSRLTMSALYKDADVAKQKMSWAMQLAAKTPFDIGDVKSAIIGFKSIGLDADTMMKGLNGKMRSFLEYVGDLGALRPDQGMQGALMAIRELSGGDAMSFKKRFEVDPTRILGRKVRTDTQGLMEDIVTISQKMANNLMEKLNGSWTQLISNLQDQATRFLLGISDAGAFDSMKGTLKYLSDAVENIDDEKLANLGKNLSSAFDMIWKPIDFVARRIIDLVFWIEKLSETSPLIGKLVLGFMTLLGVTLTISGVFLKLAGTSMIALSAFGLLLIELHKIGGISLAFHNLGFAIKGFMSSILPMIAVAGLVYLAWRTNFLGIRDILQNFMSNMYTAFSYSLEVSESSVDGMMKAMENLKQKWNNGDIFAGLTIALIYLRVIWKSVVDAWNDNTLSDENFIKCKKLGILPLIEGILNLKNNAQQFFKGFQNGWKFMSKIISGVASTIGKAFGKIFTFIYNIIHPTDILNKKMNKFKDLSSKIKPDSWRKIGDVIGSLVPIILGVILVVKVLSVVMGIANAVALASPVTWIILGIMALVVAIAYLIVHWDKVKEVAKKCFESMKAKAKDAVEGIKQFFAPVGEFFSSLWTGIVNKTKPIWKGLITFFSGLFQVIKGIFKIFFSVIIGISRIKAIVMKAIWKGIDNYFSKKWNNIAKSAKKSWDKVSKSASKSMNKIKKSWDKQKKNWNRFCSDIKKSANKEWKELGKSMEPAVKKVKDSWKGTKKYFSTLWGDIKKSASKKWAGIAKDSGLAKSNLQAIWSPISSYFSKKWAEISKSASEKWTEVCKWATTAKQNVETAWNGITGFFSGIWGGIKSGAESLFSYLEKKFGWLADMIAQMKSAMSDMGEGIGEGWENIKAGGKKMLGLSTGGYVKETGIACLHPNEVVVNDETTSMLRSFLMSERSGGKSSVARISNNSHGYTSDTQINFEKGSIVIQGAGDIGQTTDQLIATIERKLERRKQIKSMNKFQPA